MPTLALLGPVLLDEQPLPDHLTTHLLALHPAGLPRTQVAARLWPALAPEAAARNLRKTLHRLRAEGHAALWTEAGGRLRLAVPCDLAEAERRAPADALPLHRAALADGLRDDAGWLAPARVAALALWRRTLLAALPALAPAAELLRLRMLDPHDEALARAHLELLAAAGRRDEHDRVRAAWVRALADDLGVAVAPEPPAQGAPVPPPMAARGAAALVGRDDELALLRERLAEPGAWLALRGPGGIGKSRLAAAWAEHAALQGLAVWWWPLADATTPEAAFARLAVELDLDDARPAALAAHPSLLAADHAEHLLDLGDLAALALLLPQLRRSAAHGEASLMTGVEMLTMLFHVRRGEPALAWPFARACWNAALAIGKHTQQLELAMHAAEAWAAAGDRATGLAWLAWMRRQPVAWQDNRAEADRLWARLAPGAAEAAAAEAAAAGLALDDLGRAIEAAALGPAPR